MDITLTPGDLGEGYALTTLQEFYERIIALTTATADATSTFVISQTAPAPEDQDKVLVLVDSANAIKRIYTYSGGTWVSPNPEAPGAPVRRIFRGSLDDLKLYDGGDTSAPGLASGPMWEEDTDFIYRFPLHAGPTQVNPATIVAPDDTGGEEVHTLTGAESGTAVHTHPLIVPVKAGTDMTAGAAAGIDLDTAGSTGPSAEVPASAAHNNMPPYLAVYFIRRTSRVFYLIG